MSSDTRRLVIALVVLALVAVTAVGFGVVRKKSSNDATTTAGAGAGTNPNVSAPTTAKGTPSTTAKAGTPTTAAGGTGGGTGGCVSWTKSAYSKPTMKDTGVYLFNENKWRIRVVSTGEAKTFTGTITASNDLDASTFKLTDPAAGSFAVKGNTATFELKGGPAAAGFDFSIPCHAEQFSVAVNTDGQAWPADKIMIGKDTKAVSNPTIFTHRL
jgi:hypothetical protein